MKYVQKEFSSVYEEKKSKFIAHFVPFDDFDNLMERLKKEHPKGRHFVYAYRYLNEFDQVVENSSDDGEPRGTSGKPCLNVLSGNEIINSAVIVVRYFGGIKLGTGGLVRAYSDAVNSVISISSLENYKKQELKNCECEYSDLSKLEYLISKLDINIKAKNFDSKVCLTLESTSQEFELLSKQLPINIKLYN